MIEELPIVVACVGVEVELGSLVVALEVCSVVALRETVEVVAGCNEVRLGVDGDGAETYTLVGIGEDGRDDTAGKLVAGAVPSEGDGWHMPGAIPEVKPEKPAGDWSESGAPAGRVPT